jgi:DNA-binding GntR family transcriptional regulator
MVLKIAPDTPPIDNRKPIAMNAYQDDPNAAVFAASSPRHLDLARALAEEIRNGRPPVGGLLPTEAELCAQWKLSRYAVRQAIQKLCSLGLVTRQAGVGTRVMSDRPQTRYTQSMDALADLVYYARGTTLQVSMRERMSASEADADLLRCAPGAKWLHIGGVRYSGSAAPEPIALVDIYVEATYGQLKGLAKTLDAPVHTMIEEQYGIKVTRVEQELQGLLIEGTDAEALQVPSGSAGMRIVRTYFVRDNVIEVTTGVHPASRFSYSMTYHLTQAPG